MNDGISVMSTSMPLARMTNTHNTKCVCVFSLCFTFPIIRPINWIKMRKMVLSLHKINSSIKRKTHIWQLLIKYYLYTVETLCRFFFIHKCGFFSITCQLRGFDTESHHRFYFFLIQITIKIWCANKHTNHLDLAIMHHWIKSFETIWAELRLSFQNNPIMGFSLKGRILLSELKNVSISVCDIFNVERMTDHKSVCHIQFIWLYFDIFAIEFSFSTICK